MDGGHELLVDAIAPHFVSVAESQVAADWRTGCNFVDTDLDHDDEFIFALTT